MQQNVPDLEPPTTLFLSARALAGTPAATGDEPAPEPAAAQEECQLVADLDHECVEQGRKAFPYLTDLRCELHLRNT